ncbi:hypothetical protein [Planomicrobium sp. CPCC 101110]|uniref:anti-sigma-I factor RsgI family protein n=1 Tax=Planomicrobium sp. CPCC 101110 TaxID=2599619 RepID=UPI00164949A2|nr:hypothetical protein [Planomicrobium sp. CPCC 101110]
MQMQKGICVEQKDSRSIFILPNGQFMEGRPATDLAVGEEGYFYPLAAKRKKALKETFVPVLVIAAVFAIMFSLFSPPQEAYAYVQVQINPGVELGVDEEGEIVSLRGLNEDGEELADKLKDWQNQPLAQVLSKVISASMTDATKEITITTVKENDSPLPLEKAVQAVSLKIANDDVEVKLKEATKAQWRKSIKEKVPVSKLVPDSIPIQKEKPKPVKDKTGNLDTNTNQEKKAEKKIKEKVEGKIKEKAKGKTKEKAKEKIEDKANEKIKDKAKDKAEEKPKAEKSDIGKPSKKVENPLRTKQKSAENKAKEKAAPQTKAQKNPSEKAKVKQKNSPPKTSGKTKEKTKQPKKRSVAKKKAANTAKKTEKHRKQQKKTGKKE